MLTCMQKTVTLLSLDLSKQWPNLSMDQKTQATCGAQVIIPVLRRPRQENFMF